MQPMQPSATQPAVVGFDMVAPSTAHGSPHGRFKCLLRAGSMHRVQHSRRTRPTVQVSLLLLLLQAISMTSTPVEAQLLGLYFPPLPPLNSLDLLLE